MGEKEILIPILRHFIEVYTTLHKIRYTFNLILRLTTRDMKISVSFIFNKSVCISHTQQYTASLNIDT